ncbi:MAG TPA: type II toxin-antitoxin system VapC family toxin [Stellaceae bacterium]|nr:type II toxin-antitoxin system VapC family toxin [Stellaceae bacterium]
MRILLDTHILLWAISTPERLGAQVRAAILNTGNEVLFSAASIWEIAIKAGLRRGDFVADPNAVVEEASDLGFIELPVRSAAAARVADLPPIHRDPFDRLLVAQAIEEPAVLYTADGQLLAYSNLVRRAGAP